MATRVTRGGGASTAGYRASPAAAGGVRGAAAAAGVAAAGRGGALKRCPWPFSQLLAAGVPGEG